MGDLAFCEPEMDKILQPVQVKTLILIAIVVVNLCWWYPYNTYFSDTDTVVNILLWDRFKSKMCVCVRLHARIQNFL